MEQVRILIVDDSASVRRVLSDALSTDPSIEVVGMAANGQIALAKIRQLKPDLVTLDVEMPVMDGLETLTEIRKLYPKLPVIMFSSITERGKSITLDALTLGANDFVSKPQNMGSVAAAALNVQYELIPKIQLLAKRVCQVTQSPIKKQLRQSANVANPSSGSTAAETPRSPVDTRNLTSTALDNAVCSARMVNVGRIDAVVIGTSTGGPNALAQIIPRLPKTLPVPVFIVQHMPPVFTARLAGRLDQQSAIRVVEATDGMKVEPATAYVAPGDYHLKIDRRGTELLVKLTQEAPECSCRPAVDVLFRSAVEQYGANLLTVVLTGMGQDGLRGCELVRGAGGYILAQDELTSVVWGMPGAISRAGLAHEILPLETIAASIEQHLWRGRLPANLPAVQVNTDNAFAAVTSAR